ncbi:MAG: carbohydrate binding domain-containing protein [Phycisphaeraceae bacterium]|nr:carbohydrate binding domain-containing protein [Phycisphaeraceae bacterium]
MNKKRCCFVVCALVFAWAASSAWSQENQIQNPEFDDDLTSWGLYGGAGFTVSQIQDVRLSGKNAVVLDVTDASAGTAIGIAQGGLLLEPDVTYPIVFTAMAEQDREMVVLLQTNLNNTSWPTQLNQKVQLTTEPQTFTLEYTHSGDALGDDPTESVDLYLMLKGSFWAMEGDDLNKKVWIDRVSFGAEPPLPRQDLADYPGPGDLATDVPWTSNLSWEPGIYAETHDVYLGTSFDDVNDATRANTLDVLVSQDQAGLSYAPERVFDFGQTYYWRVDEVNGAPDRTVIQGGVWTFEVEPYSIPVPEASITTTVSSASNDFSTAQRTIDGSGLSADGMHAISPETMWFTATVDLDPWIQYEFDDTIKLDTMKVWNSNSSAEIAIGWGVKDVLIEYSVDGESWNVLEGVSQFSRGPGAPTYDQYDEIALNGIAAKYVRLDIESNWGGILMSYSLAEVQFTQIPVTARAPKPGSGAGNILPDAVVQWRAGREAAQHTIYLGTNASEVADGTAPSTTTETDQVDLSAFDLRMGETYYWRVDEVNEADAASVWPGPVWSLAIVDTLTVDDFESYGNASPDRPFQTWLDGFGYSADEFFAVGFGGNGTGAGIGHDIWGLSSPHYNGDIMETSLTMPGSGRSMPFYYGNTGGVASQTERTFATPQDWTSGGAQTLSIAFAGAPDNTGQLYAKVNGTKVLYDGDAANLALAGWQTWLIDLAGLGGSLENVTTLEIGVEGAGAAGLLYLDNILLLPDSIDSLIPGAAIEAWETAATADAPTFLATNVVDGVYDVGAIGGDITYEFIVRSNPNEAMASMGLMGRNNFGDSAVGLKYEQWNNTGTYGITVFGVADHDFGVPTAPGEDTHLVFISSEAAGTTNLYVNGVHSGEIAAAVTLSGNTGIGSIAMAEDGSTSGDDFDGSIFGAAVYNAALSEATIAAHADAFLK